MHSTRYLRFLSAAWLVLALVALAGGAPAAGQVPATRFTEAALDLGEPRPCINAPNGPIPGLPDTRSCRPERLALWNGDAAMWARFGVADPDARFNETVVFRVQAGDPVAIGNIAKILGWPYVKVTKVHFGGDADPASITNLGGGPQEMTGWTLRSPDRNLVFRFPDGFVLGPGASQFICGLACFPSCPVIPPGRPPVSCPPITAFHRGFGRADVWPDDAGRVVLFYDALALPGDDTRYSADPANQPPPPNLQGVEPPMTTAPAAAVEFTLSTSKERFAPGEPVEFRMVLRNAGSAPLELTFNSGQRFDVTVSTEGGDKVWQWALGKLFTQVVSTITLAPGESTAFTATWDQQPNGPGVAGAPGMYRAQAVLTAGERPVSNTVAFRIGGS